MPPNSRNEEQPSATTHLAGLGKGGAGLQDVYRVSGGSGQGLSRRSETGEDQVRARGWRRLGDSREEC